MNDTAKADASVTLSRLWRILGRLGLLDTIFNHASVSYYRADAIWLAMNPAGLLPHEVFPDQVCHVPLVPSDDELYGEEINPDGLSLHRSVQGYRLRPGVVVHTHSDNCVTVASTKAGLLPLTQTAIEFALDTELADYDGLFSRGASEDALSAVARRSGTLLLRNHGALIVADSAADAAYSAYYLEEACRLQRLMLSMHGQELITPPDQVVRVTAASLQGSRARVAEAWYGAQNRLHIPSGES